MDFPELEAAKGPCHAFVVGEGRFVWTGEKRSIHTSRGSWLNGDKKLDEVTLLSACQM